MPKGELGPLGHSVVTLGASSWGAALKGRQAPMVKKDDLSRQGAAAAMRQLEDYFAKFPVDNPASAERGVRLAANRPNRAQTAPTAPVASSADKELRRTEREISNKRAQKESAQKSMDLLRRQKIDQWSSLAERNNRRLRRENDALKRIADLTQANALDNDARCEEALAAMRAQVEYAGLYRSDNDEAMEFVRDSVAAIQRRVAEMRGSAEEMARRELGHIRDAFERQVAEQARRLDDVRRAGESTREEWVQKNKDVQEELEDVKGATDAALARHEDLVQQHQRLVVDNDVHAEDTKLLARQWTVVSAQHRRLRDRVHELEMALAKTQRRAVEEAGGPADDPDAPEVDEAERKDVDELFAPAAVGATAHEKRIGAVVRRAEDLLTAEAKQLKSVRAAHVEALKQRTELEVFLRQAVLRYQQRLTDLHASARAGAKARSGGTGIPKSTLSGPGDAVPHASSPVVAYTAFTTDDRRVVMDALLHTPRVLQLLFPPTPDAGGPEQTADVRADLAALGIAVPTQPPPPAPPRTTVKTRRGDADQAELEQLWQRWKAWATQADAALRTQDGRDPFAAAAPPPDPAAQ